MWLISAVARAIKPGCDVQTVLVLEGPQGARKSKALKILFGAENVLDSLADIGTKDAAQQLTSAWCVELAELDHLSRADKNTVKRWISVPVDTYRPFYGRRQARFPRPSIFVATHNPSSLGWQSDETGGRRWWPVAVTSVDTDALTADRDQIWAEAVHRYMAGERHWFDDDADEDAARQARQEQDDRRTVDAWEDVVSDWLRSTLSAQVTTGEILSGAIGVSKDKWDRTAQTRIGAIMSRMDEWEKIRLPTGLRPRVYRRRGSVA